MTEYPMTRSGRVAARQRFQAAVEAEAHRQWMSRGIPIGYGCGMLLVAAWRWGR